MSREEIHNVTESVKLRFLRIKAAFEESEYLLEQELEIYNALSLVLMDNALEQAMWIALEVKGELNSLITSERGKSKDNIGVGELLNKIRTVLPKKDDLPLGSILKFREERNNTQHGDHTPSNSDMERYHLLIGEALNMIFDKVFHFDYDKVSKALLIKNEFVKDLYISAEEDFGERRYKDCVLKCSAAFQISKSLELIRQYGTYVNTSREKIQIDYNKETYAVGEIGKIINELQWEIYRLKLGLNSKTYQKFEKIFQSGLDEWNYLGSYSFQEQIVKGDFEIDPIKVYASFKAFTEEIEIKSRDFARTALFCLQFIISHILMWER